jgi:hypothetical protein
VARRAGRALLPAGDLRSLIVDGVIAGVGSVLVFLPQIAMLFLFIGILEDSGYMARAAFLMDGLMRRVGLHGKSFIPMLSGYACAVPGIMAARTVENDKDRLATIMVVPLMSCSARLPIYALLIGAFVPPIAILGGALTLQGLTMLGMYFLGTVTALGVAALFKRTLLRGPARPMILELPAYRLPSLTNLGISVYGRASMFVRRAGTVILALSVLLWAMATYPKTTPTRRCPPPRQQEQQLERLTARALGHTIDRSCARWVRLEDRRVDRGQLRRARGVRGDDGHDLRRGRHRARRRGALRERCAPSAIPTPGGRRTAAGGGRHDGVLRVRPHVHEHRRGGRCARRGAVATAGSGRACEFAVHARRSRTAPRWWSIPGGRLLGLG